jgi:iron(III) transport system ATP-binding protein
VDWPALSSALSTSAFDGREFTDVLVRPEDVIPDADGVECAVEAVLYEGERYALRLALPDGQILRAYSRRAVARGDRLRVVVRAGWRL